VKVRIVSHNTTRAQVRSCAIAVIIVFTTKTIRDATFGAHGRIHDWPRATRGSVTPYSPQS